jgi:hypothetical protein
MVCSKKKIIEQWTNKILKDQAKNFNHFKNEQDQKYLLWSEFSDIYLTPKHGIKITKYTGSNQVIVTKNGKYIYYSDDGKLSMAKFKKVIGKMLEPLPLTPLKKCK